MSGSMSGGRRPKRPRPTDQTKGLPWKSVDVSIDQNEDENDQNHYDDKSLQRAANKELMAQPEEDVAIVLGGLEVLSGDDYRVVRSGNSQTFVMSTKNETDSKKESKISSESEAKDIAEEKPKTKKKRKKKKKAKRPSESTETPIEDTTEQDEPNPNEKDASDADTNIENSIVANSWLGITGVDWHESILKQLHRADFATPTPIQRTTLAAAANGRNIVGAAPTGSGKTLAYLLPIIQYLTTQKSLLDDEPSLLQALILTPTRELTQQVHKECQLWYNKKSCGMIVGGLALPKQERILQRQRPPILVATPGRLWELISSRRYPHLNQLERLKFLVVDEADRMIAQGSFPQLAHILTAIHEANPMDDGDEEEAVAEDDESDGEQVDRLLGLPGVRGEAKLVMLSDDILKRVQQQSREGAAPDPLNMDDDEEEEVLEMESNQDEDEISLPALPPVERQTLVFSATLTLPYSGSAQRKSKFIPKSVDGAIAEILQRAHVHGKTKVVDLSLSSSGATAKATDATKKGADKPQTMIQLPPGLVLQEIKCTQRHKDSHLYAYMTTVAPAGPCLVFCNSIAGVRRVGATLETLRLPVKMLHANMQQRARFKVLEALRQASTTRMIVVCTDIAARGLDITGITTVVHYDAARTVDSFVHRAGRTARGVGDTAVGQSLSLVASGEDKAHVRIVASVNATFETVPLDSRLLQGAQERVNLASKIVSMEDSERRTNQSNQWFKEKAADAGIEIDEDMLDEGLAGGDGRDVAKLQQGKAAKRQLRQLLSQPMQTQRFGKFLSTRLIGKHRTIEPISETNSKSRRKRRRR